MKRQPTPEGALQRTVMDLLLAHRIPAIRLNSGSMRSATGVPVAFARWMDGSPVSGLSDILMLVNGRAVFVELKAPRGTQRPSQIEFERWATAAGCTYLLVREVDEIIAFLEGKS